MKFDYCIGNPPYQESKNGNNKQIWPEFVANTSSISNISCMIHPGRWAIQPKEQMKKVQEDLIKLGLYKFNLFPLSNDCFNNTSIHGGISITLIKNNYKGKILYSINGIDKGEYITNNIIFTDNLQEEAYKKVFKNIDVNLNMMKYIIGKPGRYGTDGGYNKSTMAEYLVDSPDSLKNPIKIYASKGYGKGGSKFLWYYIEKDLLINPPIEIFETRKVMLNSKGHHISETGKGNVIANTIYICDKNVTGNSVFFVLPKNDTDRELELIKSLFLTKTARYLMCITMNSVHVRGFENIPDYIELSKLLSDNELFTDKWFYKTFDFSKELINEIETRVSEKID